MPEPMDIDDLTYYREWDREIAKTCPLAGFLEFMPREMRDAVWEICGQDAPNEIKLGGGMDDHAILARLENAMNPDLLTVCKDFSKEYGRRLRYAATLKIRDHAAFEFATPIMPDKEYVKYIRNLEVQLIVFCRRSIHKAGAPCGGEVEVLDHVPWLHGLVRQLPALRNISVDIFVCYKSVRPSCQMEVPCEKNLLRNLHWLMRVPHIQRLRVFRHDFEASKALGTNSVKLFWWSSEAPAHLHFAPKPPKRKQHRRFTADGKEVFPDESSAEGSQVLEIPKSGVNITVTALDEDGRESEEL